MDEEYEGEFDVEFSPLCQAVSRTGKTVQVTIYGDGEGKWILEIEDGYGNSCVWNDLFETDQLALEEALTSIEEDGIDSFIGPPPEDQD